MKYQHPLSMNLPFFLPTSLNEKGYDAELMGVAFVFLRNKHLLVLCVVQIVIQTAHVFGEIYMLRL
jgi:hypothetical protein